MYRLFLSPVRAVSATARRRPRTTLSVGLLVLLGVGAGGAYGYVRYHRRAGEAALAANNPAAARPHLDKALAVWPWSRSVEGHRLAGRAARMVGDFAAAEAHLNRALKLNDGATQGVQVEYLLLRAQTGDIDRVATPLFELCEAGHPDGPVIFDTLSLAYLQALRFKLAWTCATRWLELYPDTPKAYLLRGFALERLNNYKAAAADYHRALALNPDDVTARLRVAEMLIEDKQTPEAIPHLERLIRLAPDDPRVQSRLGMCRVLEGKPEEARRLMEAGAARLPADPALAVALAQLDVQEGRGAEAEARLRKVLAGDRADTEARYTLAPALRLQGKTGEAEAELKLYEKYKTMVERSNHLLREVPDRPDAPVADLGELGELLLGMGRDRQGVEWLERALEKDQSHQPTLKALAAYYEGKGDATQAAAYKARIR